MKFEKPVAGILFFVLEQWNNVGRKWEGNEIEYDLKIIITAVIEKSRVNCNVVHAHYQ